jgi:hypothetical protein
MAHDHHDQLRGSVGTPLFIPMPNDNTGIVIGDLLSMEVGVNGLYVATPIAALSMVLLEVDAINAPGLYFLRMTPQQEGQYFIHFTHGAHDFEYSIEVARLETSDASLEGEYVLTVEDGVGAVQGAVVRVFDAAGSSFVTRGTTDSNGEVVFTLPVGNYQIRAFKDGVDFSAINPTTITVTATDSAAPIIYEALPITGSIGDVIAVVGSLFDPTSQVVFGTEATVAADHVNPSGTVLLVTVPVGLTVTAIPLQVDKPDPANQPLGKLFSNTVTWVRT